MGIEDLQPLTLILLGLWCLFNFMFWEDTARTNKLLCFVISGVWLTSNGWEEERVFVKDHYNQKVLVSAAPSHTQINGSISGNFLMFSGVIGEQRVYLLREEVSKGLYKDFEVKHEVYIREDESLTDKGKFVQYFKCYNKTVVLDFYGWQVLSLPAKYDCDYQRQEIVVPQGSVIKELNI